jgi:hypothetical protein
MEATTSQDSHHRQRKTKIAVEVLMILLTIAIVMAGFIRILPTLIRQPGSYDFAAYYVAARVLNAGDALYDDAHMMDAAVVNGEKVSFPKYIYPPFFAVLLRPIAGLSFITASRIWFVFNLLCLIISVALISRIIGIPRSGGIALGLLALILPPIYDTLLLGQVNLILLLLIVLSLYFVSRSGEYRWNEILAGLFLGIAVVIKIYPITIGFAFLIHRRVVAFISMIFGILLVMSIGITAGGGIDNTIRYFNQVLPSLSESGPGVTDQSIWPVVIRLFSFNQYRFAFLTTTNYVEIALYPIINAPRLGYLLASVGALVIATLTIRTLVLRAIRAQDKFSLLLDFSLLIPMTLLILPVVHDHYLSLLLIPLSLVIWIYYDAKGASVKSTIRILLVIFCLLLGLQRFWRLFLSIIPSPLLLCFGFLGMLLLWLLILRLIGSSVHQPKDALEARADA